MKGRTMKKLFISKNWRPMHCIHAYILYLDVCLCEYIYICIYIYMLIYICIYVRICVTIHIYRERREREREREIERDDIL